MRHSFNDCIDCDSVIVVFCCCVCSLLYQVQQVLGHLLESKLQYYIPERFWQVFHLWGNTPVNIREQQDALDFFQAFIDQVDEQIKVPIHSFSLSEQNICNTEPKLSLYLANKVS